MRYLSQATLSPEVALRAGLTDGYAWHHAVWGAFPGRPDDTRDFLFRTDKLDGGFRVLLLSDHKPESAEPFTWKTKEVGAAFLQHTTYRFQLRVNPTMRRSSDKRRLAITDETKLRAWLARKAAASGVDVAPETLAVGAPVAETFIKDGRRGKHVAVDFEGILRVIERSRFIQAFTTGIGSAKGFGYGLLMLQPLT